MPYVDHNTHAVSPQKIEQTDGQKKNTHAAKRLTKDQRAFCLKTEFFSGGRRRFSIFKL